MRRLTFSGVAQPVTRTVAAAGGALLAGSTSAIGAALARTKPLHPDGELREATLAVLGAEPPASGVPWIDEPGELRAVVRISRAVGLPRPLPDIAGLALRIELPGGPADILLASTGTGPLTRFLLAPRLPGRPGVLTSLLPYRAPAGPVLLSAVPVDERTFELRWADGTGPWRTFAVLHLGALRQDQEVSFDPVLNTAPFLDQYAWVRRLREPSYQLARARSDRTVRR